MEGIRNYSVRSKAFPQLQQYWSLFLDLIFPPLCHSCRAYIPDSGEIMLCASCLAAALPVQSPLCLCCGRPFATQGGIDHLCGTCTTEPPPYLAARAALLHEEITRELIHRFKYSHKVILRRPLALLAARHLENFVSDFGADLIVPVPLHNKRLRQRGFNQALLLAEIFSDRWDIPLSRNNLKRIRWTEPQVNLNAPERVRNVKGAFSLTDEVESNGKRVLLVDDVYTTGSTVKECSRVLKRGGAAEVVVLTIARAVD
jgi:ComF family protein